MESGSFAFWAEHSCLEGKGAFAKAAGAVFLWILSALKPGKGFQKQGEV
jgi:hypothetical protein